MKPAAAKMSYDQYLLLPENGKRFQLFDGELAEMTPAPTPRHQKILGEIYLRLASYDEAKSLGSVYIAPIDIRFDEYTVVEPDLLFIRKERLHIVGERAILEAPDLVVEVLSPSTFYDDLRRKMDIYSRFGVLEYWIADGERQTLELYERKGAVLELRRKFERSETLESALLPGFRLPLKDIF
jgi:Uma2 family endonuclease